MTKDKKGNVQTVFQDPVRVHLPPLDVRCVDAHEVRKQHPHARLNGFESGQLVIDKARCWRALTFANWCGERSAFFFNHVYGDKELFHLCWRKLGQEYAMPSRGILTLPGTMCQHDFDGSGSFSTVTDGSGQ